MRTASRIRALRERSGATEAEICRLLAITDMEYYDLEAYDAELESVLSLHQVQLLAQRLGVSVHQLAVGSEFAGESLPLEAVPQLVLSAMEREDLSIEAFEDRVGWDLREFLSSPRKVAHESPIMFLRDVASGIGADYLRILGSMGQHAA